MTDKEKTAIDHAFLGQGWNFPIQFNQQEGSVQTVGGAEDIEQSLSILFNTLPGERVTNLGYGSKVKAKLYDPIDSKSIFLIEETIRHAIASHESRIRVESVNLNYDQQQEGLIILELSYTIKLTNSRHNLVYPFSQLEANI